MRIADPLSPGCSLDGLASVEASIRTFHFATTGNQSFDSILPTVLSPVCTIRHDSNYLQRGTGVELGQANA